MIIQIESPRIFKGFVTYEEFESWYDFHQKDCMIAEVILDQPQKLRFDIDGIEVNELARNIIKELISKVQEYFPTLTPIIYNSCGPKKTSYHLVFNGGFFPNHKAAYTAATWITRQISSTSLIDLSVYKTTQLFRLEGCTKKDQNRYKYRETPVTSWREGWITYGDHPFLSTPSPQPLPPSLPPPFVQTKDITAIVFGTYVWTMGEDFRVRAYQGDLVLLDRIRPTYCPACERIHEHENPYILLNKRLFCCRRSEVQMKVLLRCF